VLLEGTYLGVLGYNPVAIEVVVPELTLPGVDTAVVSATRNALELVRAFLVPQCRWNWVGLGFLVALAQPAALTVLVSRVRTATNRAPRSVGAPSGWVTLDATILAPGDTDAFGCRCNRARHSTYENALSNERL
jgi:hypothetical protein